MTTNQILRDVKRGGKNIVRSHLYNLFKTLGIVPLAARQRPQQYPSDSPQRILNHFGLFSVEVPAKNQVARSHCRRAVAVTKPANVRPLVSSEKLISARVLRAAKTKQTNK